MWHIWAAFEAVHFAAWNQLHNTTLIQALRKWNWLTKRSLYYKCAIVYNKHLHQAQVTHICVSTSYNQYVSHNEPLVSLRWNTILHTPWTDVLVELNARFDAFVVFFMVICVPTQTHTWKIRRDPKSPSRFQTESSTDLYSSCRIPMCAPRIMVIQTTGLELVRQQPTSCMMHVQGLYNT